MDITIGSSVSLSRLLWCFEPELFSTALEGKPARVVNLVGKQKASGLCVVDLSSPPL